MVAGKEHEQVDVRVQAQLAAAVAAEREDRHRLRGRAGLGKELLDERVHAVRVLAQRVASAFAALGGGDELAAGGLEPRAGTRGRAEAGLARDRRRVGLGHRRQA